MFVVLAAGLTINAVYCWQLCIAAIQGSITGLKHSFQLDRDHNFETGRSMAVCGNTAAMLGEDGTSWLSKHFEVLAWTCVFSVDFRIIEVVRLLSYLTGNYCS